MKLSTANPRAAANIVTRPIKARFIHTKHRAEFDFSALPP